MSVGIADVAEVGCCSAVFGVTAGKSRSCRILGLVMIVALGYSMQRIAVAFERGQPKSTSETRAACTELIP